MTKCIAFHSYKGGTGKTTISTNLSTMLANKGYNVFLLDLDVYAPSLGTYFDVEKPTKWINDFLFGDASIDDIFMDMTRIVAPNMKGKLHVGFSNADKEEIYKLDGNIARQNSQMQFLRNFILLREELIMKKNADFVIIDTSPGIRYWSINSLAVSDIVFLTLKMGDLDVDGTKKMAQDIYGSFIQFGTKCYLLLNRGSGYCTVPQSETNRSIKIPEALSMTNSGQMVQNNILTNLVSDINLDVISEIPCYCDIQFSPKEFLTGLKCPEHPFTMKLHELIEKLETYKTTDN